jgi:cytochrome c1
VRQTRRDAARTRRNATANAEYTSRAGIADTQRTLRDAKPGLSASGSGNANANANANARSNASGRGAARNRAGESRRSSRGGQVSQD